MKRLWAMVGMGFLGFSLSGCGGAGDMMAPDEVPTTQTQEQIDAEKEYEKTTAGNEN